MVFRRIRGAECLNKLPNTEFSDVIDRLTFGRSPANSAAANTTPVPITLWDLRFCRALG